MAVKIAASLVIEALIFGGLLFGAAGTFDWPASWIYLGLFFGGAIGITILIALKDPALLAERMKPPVQKGQPFWDKMVLLAMGIAWAGWLALMGLDAGRFHWSAMPVQVQFAGGVLLALSFVMIARVFRENTFLSSVVKIQKERGHHVISTGPYAVVRHPMYAGVLVHFAATALLLGSWYGLAASVVLAGGLAYRTAKEDRTLHEELAGYREYAARVRYRLIPFVW